MDWTDPKGPLVAIAPQPAGRRVNGSASTTEFRVG
jgi:hypothetical protein